MTKIKFLKESITELYNKAEDEKRTILDSIEMMWLNADIQRKKSYETNIPEEIENNITRIRELLACAWFEDLKK